MALASVDKAGSPRAGDLLTATVAERGSAAHPYLRRQALLQGPHANRNLADAIGFLCTVHGRHPDAIEMASRQICEPHPREWLAKAIDGFAAERAFLARLAAAAGPTPGTPAAAESDLVVMSQCHAIEMLSKSERKGCAIGAALALAVDWGVVREVLDVAAERFGVDAEPYDLNNPFEIRRTADMVAASPAVQRAMLFGAEQISLQHYGLWDLLEARQLSRGV